MQSCSEERFSISHVIFTISRAKKIEEHRVHPGEAPVSRGASASARDGRDSEGNWKFEHAARQPPIPLNRLEKHAEYLNKSWYNRHFQ